jgi:hypothetical protein
MSSPGPVLDGAVGPAADLSWREVEVVPNVDSSSEGYKSIIPNAVRSTVFYWSSSRTAVLIASLRAALIAGPRSRK